MRNSISKKVNTVAEEKKILYRQIKDQYDSEVELFDMLLETGSISYSAYVSELNESNNWLEEMLEKLREINDV